MHLRFNHAPVSRLQHLNGKVRGLPRNLRATKTTRTPCFNHTCDIANAKHSAFPDPSTHKDNPSKTVWQMDLFDMGETFKTLSGNRYATFFVIRETRFVMLFLHKTRDVPTLVTTMQKARARAGSFCDILVSDGAGEFTAPAFQQYLLDNKVDHHLSNADEQFQNALAETFVHTVGKGIRALLLQSGLGPEFWGLTALHVVTVYNCLPHSALDFAIPHTLQFGRQPDVSWFRPFGCSSVVFRGKDVVEHHKIVPRGEHCVSVGLGLMHG
jgi:transposase InsO family protein